jgi:predicted nucleic acid-binding protein
VAELVATVPAAALASRAFELAARHRFSAYDGLYLALAENRQVPVYTFDAAFARRASKSGFAELIEIPDSLLG